MRILFWNIRGLGSAGRRKLLLELINKYNFDGICIQETIKASFK
jgi:exonuclease III